MNLRQAARRVARATILRTWMQPVATPYGLEMHGPPLDATYHMICRGAYGTFVKSSLERADADCLFLDVGANIGLFSCLMYNHFRGRVLSFEPSPYVFRYLQLNLLRNKCVNALALCAAVSDSDAEHVLLRERGFHSGGSSILPSAEGGISRVTNLGPAILSKLLNGKEKFALKIDVEGAEEAVVTGLENAGILTKTDFAVVEITAPVNDDGRGQRVREMFKRNGLQLVGRELWSGYGDEVFERR